MSAIDPGHRSPSRGATAPDGCCATARNTSLVRPTGSPHRWVSSLRCPRASQRRVRALWPRLAPEQGCPSGCFGSGCIGSTHFGVRARGDGQLAPIGKLASLRTSISAPGHGRAWRLSRAACGQPDRVFWPWVFWLLAPWRERGLGGTKAAPETSCKQCGGCLTRNAIRDMMNTCN